jgi:hypothetical protein
MQRLSAIRDVSLLLPAWQDPVEGERIPPLFEDSIAWIRRIHAAVRASRNGSKNPHRIVSTAMQRLGLRPETFNPLSELSLRSHLPVLDDPLLL